MESTRYQWEIFSAGTVRKSQLAGTPYRYWSSFAIAHVLQKRLSGRIDFLDAGGRDGGTLELLRSLSLRGTYTLVDLQPKMKPQAADDFEIEAVQSAFSDFQPRRQFDAILFQSCLECVESYADIAWARECLKPGGFILATIACKDTKSLYPGFWEQGGKYLLDEQDLAPAFARIGLRIVWVAPLGGTMSRICQHLFHGRIADFTVRACGKFFPRLGSSVSRLLSGINAGAARMDRVTPFWRIGHCVVLEKTADS